MRPETILPILMVASTVFLAIFLGMSHRRLAAARDRLQRRSEWQDAKFADLQRKVNALIRHIRHEESRP
jgi:cell division protein FtsB